MIDLSSIVNTIRTAIYGKDMREAIAQGFEKVQDEAASGGDEEGLGGGFILMEESIPVSQRKENVLYGLIVANFDDEGPTG